MGCTDAAACNYDELATEDDGSCEFPVDLYGSDALDCDGNCLADADGDEICDGDEIAGCQDETACNFDPTATDDDGSCSLPLTDSIVTETASPMLTATSICDGDEIAGCQDDTACNFDAYSHRR